MRVFFLGGLTAYRALFAWRTPLSFCATLLVNPVLQVVFFVVAARGAARSHTADIVVGASLMACAVPGIFGGAMAVGNERRFGTLAVVVAAPARLLTIFLGRCLPHIVNGTLAAVVVFVASGLVVDAGPGVGAVPRLALAGLCGAVACTGLGLAIGLAGLVLRDIWLAGNLATLATLILSGAVVPPAALWPALASAAPAVPLHNAIAVARGAPLPGLLLELAVGAALALITVVGLRLVERRARTTGALDLW